MEQPLPQQPVFEKRKYKKKDRPERQPVTPKPSMVEHELLPPKPRSEEEIAELIQVKLEPKASPILYFEPGEQHPISKQARAAFKPPKAFRPVNRAREQSGLSRFFLSRSEREMVMLAAGAYALLGGALGAMQGRRLYQLCQVLRV
jgi:hypothetical protein